MKIILVLSAIFLAVVLDAGAESKRFVKQIKLPTGQIAVVAEGDLEPRSIGSYSVRLYSGANPKYPTNDFVAGIIKERDGGIDQVLLADLAGDGHVEIIVITRSAGSGGYLSAQSFALGKRRGSSTFVMGS